MADKAGHDINYLSMTGGLYLIGPHDGVPVPPINYVANFGGGGMLMAVGVLGALVERSVSGRGQVIDAAMVDGASLLATQIFSWMAMGRWRPGRGGNLLDGSAYFYRCYRTADDRFVAVGALEPQFHDNFVRGAGLDPHRGHAPPVLCPGRLVPRPHRASDAARAARPPRPARGDRPGGAVPSVTGSGRDCGPHAYS